MTVALEAHGRSAFFNLLSEHNPFYLLSAACMLAGCLALTNTTTFSPITLGQLIPLIITLNIYELAVIGLALVLVRKRGLVRDGRVLLILQAMFLVDMTFLNAEIVTLDLTAGLIANGIIFALAIAKLAVVLRVLEVRLPAGKCAFIGIQLLVLFALPVIFKWMDRDAVSPLRFYAAWWVVGLLPAVYEVLSRLPWGTRIQSVAPAAQAAPTMWYLALPYASLMVHLGILHFVYNTPFFGAHAAPVLLGLALIVSRIPISRFTGRKDLLTIRLLLPGAAILVSLNNPYALHFVLGENFEVTPRMLGIAGAYLVYVYCFLLPWAIPMLGGGVLIGLMYVFGPTATQVGAWGSRGLGWIGDGVLWVIPQTARAWGIVGVVAAFVFLAVGGLISLKKQPQAAPSAVDTGEEPEL